MKISQDLADKMSQQVKIEFESAYLYLSMANYLQMQGWEGMAHWFRMQAIDEETHAMKLNDFLLQINHAPELLEIDQPKSSWNKPIEIFQEAYDHECEITKQIDDLVSMSLAEKNYAVFTFLQWFSKEQTEEEAETLELLEKANAIGNETTGMIQLNAKMGTRPTIERDPIHAE